MRSILCLLVSLFLCFPALAQQGTSDEIGTVTKQLFDAVDAQKWDDAISALKRLDQLQPETQGNAYNLACMYSRKAAADESLAWMDKAIQWGWGGGRGGIYAGQTTQVERMTQVEMTAKDSDLEFLRKDARYAKLAERMLALAKRAAEYATAPALYVPEKLKDAPEVPLLLVLHGAGGNKDATLAAWKPIADELGCALAVPAAPYPLREDASRGWGWIDDPLNFALPNRTAEYQKPVTAALDALRKTKKLAPNKLWIAGQGQGATLALVTGLHNSDLLKGVALLDADVVPALCGYKVPSAKANGLRLEARFDTLFWKTRPGLDLTKGAVVAWALGGSVSEIADVKDAAARQAALVDAVRALAKAAEAAANPAPAVAPK
jgi:poly(3-hydroxybutyrate) depolymerase